MCGVKDILEKKENRYLYLTNVVNSFSHWELTTVPDAESTKIIKTQTWPWKVLQVECTRYYGDTERWHNSAQLGVGSGGPRNTRERNTWVLLWKGKRDWRAVSWRKRMGAGITGGAQGQNTYGAAWAKARRQVRGFFVWETANYSWPLNNSGG